MGISDSFLKMITDACMSPAATTLLDGHLQTVKTRLQQAFDVSNFKLVGSYSRGSSVANHSDADLFTVFTRDALRRGDTYVSSNTALENIRRELAARYPNTPVCRDVQAVVVEFTDSHVDVVPSYFDRFQKLSEKDWPIYRMPDGSGGWMDAAPDLHNAWILQEDAAAGGKLKYTAMLAKVWRHCRTPAVPISSFYIEMVLASEGICKGAKGYADCLTELFQALARRECRAMQDPLGVSGYISCANTAAKVEACLTAARYARDHAKSAISADDRGDLAEARRQWDLVFNGGFPWL